jgi:hypothetical protein
MMMTEKMKFNGSYGCCSGFCCVIIMIQKMALIDDKMRMEHAWISGN